MFFITRSAAAIVNGAPASPEHYAAEFAWTVALESPSSDGVCTAALVSPTWVLTAAHCASTGVRLRAGNADRTRAATLVADRAVAHPLYDAQTGDYDVGLIHLSKPVTFAPARLATRAEATRLLRADARAVIAGWGKRSDRLSFSERLVVSDVELRDLKLEGTRIIYFDPVSGPCAGDSGGPLLLTRGNDTVLVGIASRVVGNICAQGGGIGIYVNVGAVREFIESNVEDLPR